MTVVTLEEAKSRIEELAQRANQGESVRIKGANGCELELRPVVASPRSPKIGGQWAGLVDVGPAFFEPMPDDWLDSFYNDPIFPDMAPGDDETLADRKAS